MNLEFTALLAATFSVAFFHTFSPDHWVPFVLLGRAKKWPIAKTELTAFVAGIGHIGTSVLIALIGIFVGAELSINFASTAEIVTGSALILFGFGYALYAWRRGGHTHINMLPPSHDPDHIHGPTDPAAFPTHSHGVPATSDSLSRAAHVHGHEHDHSEHAHSQPAEDPVLSRSPFALVVIMGLTPCVALLPLAFAAAATSTAHAISVIVVYSVSSIVPILVLTFLGSKGIAMLKLNWIDRYGDVLTGVVIGAIGIMTAVLGL